MKIVLEHYALVVSKLVCLQIIRKFKYMSHGPDFLLQIGLNKTCITLHIVRLSEMACEFCAA